MYYDREREYTRLLLVTLEKLSHISFRVDSVEALAGPQRRIFGPL